MNNREIGDFGESVVADFLQRHGHDLLERNYRNRFGEIDIIVKKGGKLRFVEVKTRKSINYGYPSEAVNLKKQKRIINSAKIYISKNKMDNMDIYFDVAEVYLSEKKINYIQSAFFI